MEQKPKIIIICGPTATGKSDLAVKLALHVNGEIISADSRQVYRGLSIGTGKITKKEMRGVPHYALDIADPKKIFTVSDFTSYAGRVTSAILDSKKIPILCGGTGFYLQSFVKNTTLPNVPPDSALRKRLAGKSASELYTMLTWLDSKRASTIDAQNPRRLIRAIEIAKHLGSVPPLTKNEEKYDSLWIGLTLPSDDLRKRIHKRLHTRIDAGMITEAKKLHAKGLSWKRMEELGLEYRYLARFLQKNITKNDMAEQLETAIYHYAKRQMTWFKKNTAITWFSPTDVSKIKKEISAFLKQK